MTLDYARGRLGLGIGEAAGAVRSCRIADASERRVCLSRFICSHPTAGRCRPREICAASGSAPIPRCARNCAADIRSIRGRKIRGRRSPRIGRHGRRGRVQVGPMIRADIALDPFDPCDSCGIVCSRTSRNQLPRSWLMRRSYVPLAVAFALVLSGRVRTVLHAGQAAVRRRRANGGSTRTSPASSARTRCTSS